MTDNLSPDRPAVGTFAASPRHPEPADFLLAGWERATRAIRSLHNLPNDWDGAGGRPVSPEKIASAIRFCAVMRDARQPPPSTVYPLSDGNIMIEWRFAEGIIARFEVESPGCGEFMVTYPDDRKSQFWDYRWDRDSPVFHQVGATRDSQLLKKPARRCGRGRQDSFSLAA